MTVFKAKQNKAKENLYRAGETEMGLGRWGGFHTVVLSHKFLFLVITNLVNIVHINIYPILTWKQSTSLTSNELSIISFLILT